MFKSVVTRPWICSKCIQRSASIRRKSASALSARKDRDDLGPKSVAGQITASSTSPGAFEDDRILQQIFDSPRFWKEFSQSSKSGVRVGLFQNRYLNSPQGFEEFASASLRKAKRIVRRVLSASCAEDYRRIVQDLDRLSDLLCRVIDLSDFVRATHPDAMIQAAATRSYAMMFEYMNVLNTTTGLAKQLNTAMETTRGQASWGEQENMVAEILKRDFAKSAIDLPKAERDRFVALSQEISEVGPDFVDYMAPEKSHSVFPSSKLKGMDPILVKQFTKWGQVNLPSVGMSAAVALRTVQDEKVREEVFNASRSSNRSTIERLQTLLKKRAELAKLSGFGSFAHLTLEDKMAKSPESVNGFLRALSKDNYAEAHSISAELLKAKLANPNALSPVLQPWDKDFYMTQILSKVPSRSRNPDFLSSYFSLGRVMQGLSRLFSRLYGVRFVPHETRPGETWNSDVRRLDVISETDGHVAVLYCDLFSRPGKSPNPAHFTLRCSRLIGQEEIQEAVQAQDPLFEDAREAANDGMAISKYHQNGVIQLPTIALICDFEPIQGSSRPSLLSFSEVSTLFHEMGHAIHSILGRTDFQNVSGTRCATDFAELPSVLMEHFAADPSVLALFARHYETDEPLPYGMVSEKLALDKKFESADVENQIILSMVDQAYHSSLPLSNSFNSTQVYHSLQHRHGVLPIDPPETCWQGFFGHLYGYGATYYSYLFDRVLARRIWEKVFLAGKQGGSIDRENGERLKEHVLRHGGARDPWRCLSDVLADERVESGGERAMGVVGSWGIEGKGRIEK